MDWLFGSDSEADFESEMRALDAEIEELEAEIGWLVSPHNHKDLYHHDTCPPCIMEWAIYGRKTGGLNE